LQWHRLVVVAGVHLVLILLIGLTLPAAKAQTDNDLAVVGTGFFVSDSGHVLTNNHVVRDCRSIGIAASDGRKVNAVVGASDDTNDLALLTSSATPHR
jgi:serine protease Do